MKYVDILGHKVSKLGLGSPRPFRHGADDPAAEKLIKEAFDLGVNFYDTAPAYGSEHNLTCLPRGEVYFSTKSPHRLSLRQGWRTVPARLEAQLEKSLRELKTDYIDFYFLHAVTLNVFNKITPEIWETLTKFKEQGKVRYIGASEDAPHDPKHRMISTAPRHPLLDVFMIEGSSRWPLRKPTVGMLINGPVTKAHFQRFTTVLTGTSNLEHLKQNIGVLNETET